MIRTFVAIEIPAAQREALGRISRELDALGLDGRAVRAASIHLTLKFLGPVEESRLAAVGKALRRSAFGHPPIDLRLRRMGVFPSLERPRVVWMGVDANPALTELQRSVEEAMAELGFEKEERAFSPHLTLMRLKSAKNQANLVRHLREHGLNAEAGRFAANELHLYQSVLKPSGAEYSVLDTFSLGLEGPRAEAQRS